MPRPSSTLAALATILAVLGADGALASPAILPSNVRAQALAPAGCANGVATATTTGVTTCLPAPGEPASIGDVFVNKTPGLPAYSLVKLDGTNAGQVIEAPAGEQNVLGCAQNASSAATDAPVLVIWAGEATCKSGIQLANDLVGMDPDNPGIMKSVSSTARSGALGYRMDGNLTGPGTFYLFGRVSYRPTTILPAAYSAALSSTERFFPIASTTTVTTLSNDDAELGMGAGAIGQVRCDLSGTPAANLTIRLYKNNVSATSCTMSTSQTTCSMTSIDIASAATDRWALSAQLASSTDADDLTCFVPFTPTL